MTNEEQIEEMARIMCRDTSNRGDCEKCDFKRQEVFGFIHQCFKYDNAEAIYNAGYRKIDDNCEVITKDDLTLYKKQAVKEFSEKLKSKMLDREYNGIHYKWGAFSDNDIDELLKEYEVEE